MNIFEYATRNKLRFQSSQGLLTVEQLWELPLTTRSNNKTSLDLVARAIYNQVKEQGEISFVDPKSTADKSLEISLEIVKYIISVRQSEAQAAEQATIKSQKAAKLRDAIARAEDKSLESKSLDELKAELAELES